MGFCRISQKNTTPPERANWRTSLLPGNGRRFGRQPNPSSWPARRGDGSHTRFRRWDDAEGAARDLSKRPKHCDFKGPLRHREGDKTSESLPRDWIYCHCAKMSPSHAGIGSSGHQTSALFGSVGHASRGNHIPHPPGGCSRQHHNPMADGTIRTRHVVVDALEQPRDPPVSQSTSARPIFASIKHTAPLAKHLMAFFRISQVRRSTRLDVASSPDVTQRRNR